MTFLIDVVTSVSMMAIVGSLLDRYINPTVRERLKTAMTKDRLRNISLREAVIDLVAEIFTILQSDRIFAEPAGAPRVDSWSLLLRLVDPAAREALTNALAEEVEDRSARGLSPWSIRWFIGKELLIAIAHRLGALMSFSLRDRSS